MSPVARWVLKQVQDDRNSGFSMIELAIVILIIGIIAASTFSMGAQKIEEARLLQTNMKLDRIQEALMTFRKKNLRLPCPGDQALTQSDTDYGMEAANPGRCTGGVPAIAAAYVDAAGVVAEGAVPFNALGLPPDFMVDGWKRRFTYAVTIKLTENEAFEVYDIYENCPSITVQNDSGANRTTDGAYVVLSHGPNGHGAFTAQATRWNAGSTNVSERANCNCLVNGAFDITYNPVYVQRSPTIANTNSFDDLVRYRERWQLQTEYDSRVQAYAGPEVGFSLNQAPWISFYSKNCDTYAAMANPATVPTAAPDAMDVSRDNNYWAFAGNFTPMVYFYKRDAATGALTKLPDPPSLPTGAGANGVDSFFRRDGNYVAIAHDDADAGAPVHALTIYKINTATDAFTYLTGATGPNLQPPAGAFDVRFHPRGTHMVVTHGQAPYYMTTYIRNGDVFTALDAGQMAAFLPIPPSAAINVMAFSEDGRYFVTGLSTAPWLEVYTANVLNNGVFTKILTVVPPAVPVGQAVTAVSFDRKGRYLMVAYGNGTASLMIYRIDPATNTFTSVFNAGTTGANALTAAFSPRQHNLLMSENVAPSVKWMKYIPGDIESFPFPVTGAIPTQPVGAGRTNHMAIRHQVVTE